MTLLFEETGRSCKFCSLVTPNDFKDSATTTKEALLRLIHSRLDAADKQHELMDDTLRVEMKAINDKMRHEWETFLNNTQHPIMLKEMRELKDYIALMHVAAQNGHMATVQFLHEAAAEDGAPYWWCHITSAEDDGTLSVGGDD